tara:strand:- start:105 stop:545 length:441 start_codon:yes stop_codon:yes gene_type:complete
MKLVWLIVRIAFGALFIWSGIAKLKDPLSFADAVRNFRIIQDPIAPAMALFIPWVEVCAGIGVMAGRFARGGAFLLVGALFVFTGAVVAAWLRGLDITCGCFATNEALNYPEKVIQNVLLLVWGIAIWWKSEMESVEMIENSDVIN